MNRTPEQWLAVPKDKLGLELGKVLPRRHTEKPEAYPNRECVVCGRKATYLINCKEYDMSECHGPIKIDWNTAMEWRDKTPDAQYQLAMVEVWRQRQAPGDRCTDDFARWLANLIQPEDCLIAAALAKGETE